MHISLRRATRSGTTLPALQPLRRWRVFEGVWRASSSAPSDGLQRSLSSMDVGRDLRFHHVRKYFPSSPYTPPPPSQTHL
jgi:hypothetical protein